MPPDAPDTSWLTAYLRDRQVPCPACAFPLHDVSGDTCPQCGNEIVLTLDTVEPRLRAWIHLAVAACASAGVGLFMAALIIRNGSPPYRDPMIFWPVWFFAVSVPAAPVVLLTRRRFLRLGRAVQQTTATVGVTLVFIAFTTLILKIKFGR